VLNIVKTYDSSLLEKCSGIAHTVSGHWHGADGDEAPERKLPRELYNELSPVSLGFMAGQWHGTDVPCAHPLNGVLKGYRWHGKTFHAPDTNGTYRVDPLVMQSCFSNRLFPLFVPPFLLLKYGLFMPGLCFLAPLLSPIALVPATKHPQGTLQKREYAGKVSAAMVYNTVPIVDSFHKLDENTVLGCMVMESELLSYYYTGKVHMSKAQSHRNARQTIPRAIEPTGKPHNRLVIFVIRTVV